MSYLIFLISLFLIIIVSLDTNAQVFPVDSIVYNGDRNKNINIIIMGDGYLNSQLANFVNDSKNACDYFFTVTPFKEYKNYFNVYTIKVPSAESVTDHPRTAPDCPPETVHPLLFVNTYFNSTFDSYSIHRLLVPSDYTAVNNVIINNFPLYDLKSMLVNTLFYGGSGGSTATASLNQSSNEIILHEIGHSFANLADEYWAGDTYA